MAGFVRHVELRRCEDDADRAVPAIDTEFRFGDVVDRHAQIVGTRWSQGTGAEEEPCCASFIGGPSGVVATLPWERAGHTSGALPDQR